MAGRFLRSFSAALAILALLLVAVDAMLHLGSLLEAERSGASALRLLLERTAGTYLAQLTPVAAFAGAFWCAGVAALRREVLALKASGVSPLVAFAPVLALASGIAVLHFGALETVGVRAAASLAARKNPGATDVRVRAGGVWYHAGRVVYSVRDVDAKSGAVRDIHVYERDSGGRLTRTIRAERARRLSPQLWEFEGAVVREFAASAPAAAPREIRSDAITLRLAADRSPQLRPDELAGLRLGTLARYVRAARAGGSDPGAARTLLHNRLTGPLVVVLFAGLAVPIALQGEARRSLAWPALQGVLSILAFLFARDYGTSFAARAGDLAAAFPWLTLAAFAAFGVQQARRVDR